MTMTAERKVALVKEFATKPGDTGSPEVQVAILTERINYLKRINDQRYQTLIKLLEIRR